jgi:uncharacterized protein (DUF1778 family)
MLYIHWHYGDPVEGERIMATQTHRNESASSRETINLRASADQKALIDRAAARLGKTRTEFMLDSAREAAENALLDQRLFLLDEARYAEFVACLDAPVEPTDALRKTLSTPSPWER